MENYIPILASTQLFAGIREGDIAAMLSCLDARMKRIGKGAFVLRQGDEVGDITVLVEGKLHIQKDDYWGNRGILGVIGVGELFGEAYVAPDSGPLLNDVVAVEDSVIVCFDVKRLLTTCSSACGFHTAVVQNLVFAIAEKNRLLVQKLGYMAKRTTREKLLSYLSEEAKKQQSAAFAIPFNRQQLADFLSVDRSAMSNELCKLRDEGLLRFKKNQFELFDMPHS